MNKLTNPPEQETDPLDDSQLDELDNSPLTNHDFTKSGDFPIIGIGASAGGLEALELFLKNVPSGSGMAFVIVQHLDPTHKGVMAELLQHVTPMRVIQVRDRLKVMPDTVYLIPPNKDMSILHRTLHLLPQVSTRGLRLPIDFFFRSLGEDLQEHSIGVILSGMGSDGTLGLRTIKENAGVVFVQEPLTAKFDGMPRSAIDSGLADVIAPVEELPEKIISYLKHTPLLSNTTQISLEAKQSGLDKVIILIRIQTGHDFSLYKKSTIYRRVERRMGIHQIDRIANYVKLLQESPVEIELLFKELLIGVTNFFRDPAAWEQMKTEIFPALFGSRPSGGLLRAWVTGCSTGEEAYSLAMVFREALELIRPNTNFSLQIFATDLDRDAIDQARQGMYPLNIIADVSPDRLRRFFIQEENGYRVGKEIREMVVFAPQNLVMDPPFTHLDVLTCRNLLIYLAPELQKKLFPLFHYSLNPGGYLFLGSAETIGVFTDLFNPLEGKLRIYHRLETSMQTQPVEFPTAFFPRLADAQGNTRAAGEVKKTFLNPQATVDQIMLQNFAPAAVVVNEKGDILYISGRTGKYLEPAAGRANWNVFAMARKEISFNLSNAFSRALREKGTIILKDMPLGTNGGSQLVEVTIKPMSEPEDMQGLVLIVFKDIYPTIVPVTKKIGSIAARNNQKLQMELALQRANEELQSSREEMQTSQEELKSTNEELQSTNEELQSTNEELTTSKEEMQSLNEELQTVNHELQSRVDDLSRANNDMKNLLNSTNIATLFLDENFNVRRFTSQAAQLIKLIPSDAGRPITDIASDLIYPEMTNDVHEVLRTLVYQEKQVTTHDGRWFTVRIMPYRTLENLIDGVVITFMDISSGKKYEDMMLQSRQDMIGLLEFMPNAFALLKPLFNQDGTMAACEFALVNQTFEKAMGVKDENLRGKDILATWLGITRSHLKVFEHVAISGTPQGFDLLNPENGKLFRCKIYRPGDQRKSLCVIFEDESKPVFEGSEGAPEIRP